jgi:hypothetical protein
LWTNMYFYSCIHTHKCKHIPICMYVHVYLKYIRIHIMHHSCIYYIYTHVHAYETCIPYTTLRVLPRGKLYFPFCGGRSRDMDVLFL